MEREVNAGTECAVARSPQIVADYLRSYGAIWDRYFPSCFRRAHWQMAHSLRFDWNREGVPFSELLRDARNDYGMDRKTCLDRVADLIVAGLARCGEDKIRSASLVYQTDQLQKQFDAHHVEAINGFLTTCNLLNRNVGIRPLAKTNPSISEAYFTFFSRFGETWSRGIKRFLSSREMHPLLRIKAERCLRTYPYWNIFFPMWRHAYGAEKGQPKYRLVDDIHAELYGKLRQGSDTTGDWVRDLIDWGFLRRTESGDQVPRNRLAVVMPETVTAYIASRLAEAAPIIEAVSLELMGLQEVGAEIVAFGSGENENVPGNSTKVAGGSSPETIEEDSEVNQAGNT